MKQFKKNVLVVTLSMLTSAALHAQTNTTTEIEQLRNEINALKQMLQQNTQQQQQQAVQLSAVERQVLTTPKTVEKTGLGLTKGGAEFNLYGNVRADASYQAEGGARDMPYNQINSVPLEGNAENSDRLRSTLSATRLGLDFKAPVADQNLNAKIEVDFLGGANLDNLRIRHAYLNYGNWLIGQTWSNFATPDYIPETIDALAYVGASIKRTPQVRYTHKFTPNTNLVAAVEDPKDASMSQRMPAFTGRLNHKFNDALSVSGRAMAHEKRIQNQEEWAYGVGVGAKFDITPVTSVKADYSHVKGDSSFVSFTNPGVVATGTSIEQSEFDSITVGLTQKFNDKLHGTLAYGYMTFDKNQDYLDAVADDTKINKNLWQAWGNLFYSPVQPVSLGVEYVYGEREAFAPAANGSKKGEDNRVNLVAIYNF